MKKIFFLLLISTILLHAQAPSIAWQKNFGGNANEELTTIQKTVDGGYIISGITTAIASGDITEGNIWGAAWDTWIVKLDNTGVNIEWQKRIGGTGADAAHQIKQTPDGGFVIIAHSNSNISGYKTANSKGLFDYWVVKLDAVGNVIWDKTIGGSNDDFPRWIELTSDGGYMVGGFSKSQATGDKTENARGLQDMWIVKLDNLGNVLWDKTIGGNYGEQLFSIQQTPDDGYIICGASNSNISWEKTENAWDVYSDYWILKIDNLGNVIWDKTIGGTGIDNHCKLNICSDGGYIVAGYSNSDISGNKTENSKGFYDNWVVKLNSLGIIEWQKTIGGAQVDTFRNITNTLDGGYILASTSNSPISGDKTENSRGDYDFWIVKIDNLGTVLWDKTIGGNQIDYPHNILQEEDGSYIIGGSTESSLTGEMQSINNGGLDYWIVKLNPENLSVNQSTTNTISIYPNPTNGTINITFKQWQKRVTVNLINILGQNVATNMYSAMEYINYEINQASGIYFLTIENENGENKTFKIIKN